MGIVGSKPSEQNELIKLNIFVDNLLKAEYDEDMVIYKQQLLDFVEDIRSSNKFDKMDSEKLKKIERLNEKLSATIGTYRDMNKLSRNSYDKYKNSIEANNNELNNEYELLKIQRIEMRELLQEYEGLLNDTKEQTTFNNSINTRYLLLSLIVIILCGWIFVLNTESYSGISGSSYMKWSILIILLFFTSINLYNPPIFMIWGLLVTYVLLWYVNILG
jgi:hypothetical protein